MTLYDPFDVTRAMARDRQAFNRLVRSTQDFALGIALARLSGRRADAEDAVQEAYVRAWSKLPELREPSAFWPWLRTTLERECRAVARRDRPTTPLTENVASPESAEEAAIVADALGRLSPVEREALALCALAGRDVAGFLGVAETTVTSRLRNARQSVPVYFDPAGLSGVVSTARLDPENVRAILTDGRQVRVQRTGRRGGIEDEAAVTPHLLDAGLPVPAIVAPPICEDEPGGAISAKFEPTGMSLVEWACDSRRSFHDLDRACDLMLLVSDRLSAVTPSILADPSCSRLERCTLANELARTEEIGGPWLDHPEFADALQRLRPVVDALPKEVVFTNGGNPPNFVNVDDAGELVELWGFAWCRLEDPHYGVTKYWTYDIYPFRRIGYVERYLVHHRLTMSDLAPRLAVRALATLQREVPLSGGDPEYRDSLLAWLRKAMAEL
ncbi:hypothetical protein BH11ARM2_BH11ARM2_01780 [soil metagenome]